MYSIWRCKHLVELFKIYAQRNVKVDGRQKGYRIVALSNYSNILRNLNPFLYFYFGDAHNKIIRLMPSIFIYLKKFVFLFGTILKKYYLTKYDVDTIPHSGS